MSSGSHDLFNGWQLQERVDLGNENFPPLMNLTRGTNLHLYTESPFLVGATSGSGFFGMPF